MNAFRICLVIGAVMAAGCATAPEPPDAQRLRLAREVIDRYLPTDRRREIAVVYGTLEPVAPGIELQPAFHGTDPRGTPPVYTLGRASFIFVIDHDALARFAHDVTYVIAPTDGSPFEVRAERWWPRIDGLPLWYRDGHMQAPEQFVLFEGVVAMAWRLAGRDGVPSTPAAPP